MDKKGAKIMNFPLKKFLLTTACFGLVVSPAKASMLDAALGISSISAGIATLTNLAGTVSQIKQNAQFTQYMQMQNAVQGQQYEAMGYNLNYNPTAQAMYLQRMAEKETKEFILQQKAIAKAENDTEILTLIKKYYKPLNRFSWDYTKTKILELQEQRKGEE